MSAIQPPSAIRRHLSVLSIILFLAVWEITPVLGKGLLQVFIAPPSQVVTTYLDMIRHGELFSHVGISLSRALLGFGAAALVTIPLGFLLGGGSPLLMRLLNPTITFLSDVSVFALLPVFILLFGIGELSKVAVIFWVCQWPILFNTVTGVQGLDPLLIRAARGMGCGSLTLFFRVVVPAALPGIFTGLRLSSRVSFIVLIAAEMIGASRGLGWLVWNSQVTFQIPRLFAAVVVIALIGVTFWYLLEFLERRIVHWRPGTIPTS